MIRTRLLVLLCGALLAGAASQSHAFKCLPVYGNWCGIDYPSSGWPPPVDAFDAACMRHDLCTAAPGPDAPCDAAFVSELRATALRVGYLPRPLQWAEYLLRIRAGGPWNAPPIPNPGDALGLMAGIAAPCW